MYDFRKKKTPPNITIQKHQAQIYNKENSRMGCISLPFSFYIQSYYKLCFPLLQKA